MERKFKVGDKVKLVKKNGLGDLGFNVGDICTIDDCVMSLFGYKINNGIHIGFTDEECLELVKQSKPVQSIHIYSDGTTTTAVLKEGKKVVKESKATCHEDDEFNFETGAKLAFERLFKEKLNVVKQDKYEVGDKVKIVSKWTVDTNENSDGEMDHWLGKIMTIRKINSDGDEYYIMEEDKGETFGNGWVWNKHCIEGKVVDVSNEVKREANVGEYIKITNSYMAWGYKIGDVIRVVKKDKDGDVYGKDTNCIRTCEYVVIDGYKPPVKEMTVEEISKELGYEIKVVE